MLDTTNYSIVSNLEKNVWKITITYDTRTYCCIIKKDNFVSNIIDFNCIDTFFEYIIKNINSDNKDMIKNINIKQHNDTLNIIVEVLMGNKPMIITNERHEFHFTEFKSDAVKSISKQNNNIILAHHDTHTIRFEYDIKKFSIFENGKVILQLEPMNIMRNKNYKEIYETYHWFFDMLPDNIKSKFYDIASSTPKNPCYNNLDRQLMEVGLEIFRSFFNGYAANEKHNHREYQLSMLNTPNNLNAMIYDMLVKNITKKYHLLELHVKHSNIFFTTDPMQIPNDRNINIYDTYDDMLKERDGRNFIIMQDNPFIVVEFLQS